MTTQNKDWREVFTNDFYENYYGKNSQGFKLLSECTEFFISSLLASKQKELLEKVKEESWREDSGNDVLSIEEFEEIIKLTLK